MRVARRRPLPPGSRFWVASSVGAKVPAMGVDRHPPAGRGTVLLAGAVALLVLAARRLGGGPAQAAGVSSP